MSILDSVSSDRLNLIRFPLIAGVLVSHAYSKEAGLIPTSYAANFIRDYLSGGLAQVVIPAFFLMSGFLFFYAMKWSRNEYLRKCKSRIKTLIIPFIFWNILWFIIIAITQNIPFTAQFYAGGIPHITQSSPYDIFNLLIGIDRHPIVFQFWYIRDLVILVALTPVFHMMHKKTAKVFLVLLFLLWISGIWSTNIPSIVPSPQPVFFFYLGSYLAITGKTPFIFDKHGIILLIICLTSLGIATVFKDQSFSLFIHRIGLITGIFGSFYITKFLYSNLRVRTLLLWLGNLSFFVYAFHEPLMDIFERLILVLWEPTNDIERLLIYFTLPIIITVLSICIYNLLNRFFPNFTAIITGGRHYKLSEKTQSS
jgi:peptidoglycan/LPS O-acetylase OafA/YrhL